MEKNKLGEVVDIISGYAFKASEFKKTGVPVIRISDLDGDRVTISENTARIDEAEIDEKYLLKKGDLLIGLSGSIGKIGVFSSNELAYLNQRVGKVITKEGISEDFAVYLINNLVNLMKKDSVGGTVLNISPTTIKNYEVYLPNKNEQNLISKKLKTIESLIQTRQDQIQALDDLLESLYYEFVFTNSQDFQKVKLDDISIVRSSSRVFKKDLIEEGIPFYRGQEISLLSKNIEFEPEFYISEELYNSMKEKSGIPKKGDLLLPSIANEGQIWVVDTDKEFYFKDGRVLWINLNENKEINPVYLRYYLKYKLIQEFDSISSGSTFAELKIFILKDIDVLLPPIEKQNQFASFVEKIEKQKQILNDSLRELVDLFNSLMQDAFDGSMTM